MGNFMALSNCVNFDYNLANLIGALHEDIFACLFSTHGPNQHSANRKDTVT